MPWYFVFFLLSGFCSVLYELVWLRLSMAQFGVTTAMVSIVLSVFMAGLGLGSWASGRFIRSRGAQLAAPLKLYARIEFLIGIAGVLVPLQLRWGHATLERLGDFSSPFYYLASGTCVVVTLLPWCMLMGATIPVAMLALGRMFPQEAGRSFSFLYMANVAGAVAGTRVPLYLIELFGFRRTLLTGTACNALIAVSALLLSMLPSQANAEAAPVQSTSRGFRGDHSILLLLFATGLSSMGMELVWVRQFTPFLGNVVYGFSSILGVYLASTFLGSLAYRRWSRNGREERPILWTLLALTALLPLITAKPHLRWGNMARLNVGVAPFTGLLGFLTPMLVDRWSKGDPDKAGTAYAVNVVGCILGPLVAGFGLLPWVSERWALVALALPWIVVALWSRRAGQRMRLSARIAAYALIPITLIVVWFGGGYEDRYPDGRVLRDSTATVIATGTGMDKKLLVNGYGMTVLTPITKMMAHLPLTLLDRKPTEVLAICFGMGTTFRSLLAWNVHTTAVELDPSVPQLFGYFHANGPALLQSPFAHVVVDDGRRYLERTARQYDLITIDPPPPVEAAGSSLLYSEEFYAAARKRLRPGGIVEQWVPNGDSEDLAAMARAFRDSFPYVRIFRWGPGWQIHMLGSDQPIPHRTPDEMLLRMSPEAIADLTEWNPKAADPNQDRSQLVVAAFATLLAGEWTLDEMIAPSPDTPALRDDRPINEYYILRRGSVELSEPH